GRRRREREEGGEGEGEVKMRRKPPRRGGARAAEHQDAARRRRRPSEHRRRRVATWSAIAILCFNFVKPPLCFDSDNAFATTPSTPSRGPRPQPSRHCTEPSWHHLAMASPSFPPRAHRILGRPEDPDYFDDVDYDEEDDKDNTPSVHAHPSLYLFRHCKVEMLALYYWTDDMMMSHA
ncbi:unnamed protein product, partial [Urochloa humidicola]